MRTHPSRLLPAHRHAARRHVARRHAAPRPRHRTRHVMALCALAMVLFIGTAVASVYTQIQSKIDSSDISGLLGANRPGGTDAPDPHDSWEGEALNLLVLGSDYRGGENAKYGQAEGMRSDTAMIVHVSEERDRVDVVSIPRDLIVAIPECPLAGGRESRARPLGTSEHDGVRFNSAFATGGQDGDMSHAAACAILTVEEMTDVFIDDWAVIDMDGFRTMVDSIGGVGMCFDDPLSDHKADLDLEAGCQQLDGAQALALARARKGIGDGSDLGRIDRQHELMTAMVDEVLSANTLANPSKLLSFLSSGASSLTTSQRLGNLNNLTGLGYALRGIGSERITFMTIPYTYSSNVVVQNPEAALVWDALRADEPLPPEEAADPATDSTSDTATDGAADAADMPSPAAG